MSERASGFAGCHPEAGGAKKRETQLSGKEQTPVFDTVECEGYFKKQGEEPDGSRGRGGLHHAVIMRFWLQGLL